MHAPHRQDDFAQSPDSGAVTNVLTFGAGLTAGAFSPGSVHSNDHCMVPDAPSWPTSPLLVDKLWWAVGQTRSL